MWRTAERRFVRHVCFRNPFTTFLLGIPRIHSLPEAWGPWELQYAPPALHYVCIMPIPSSQLQKKTCLMQRSRGFGHAVVVSKTCFHVTAAKQWIVRGIELLTTVGWKWGCQLFSCPSQNVTHCRKEICSTCHTTFYLRWPDMRQSLPIDCLPILNKPHPYSQKTKEQKQEMLRFRRSQFHAHSFWEFQESTLPEAWGSSEPKYAPPALLCEIKASTTYCTRSLRSLRAAAPSTISLWLHHACKR